MEDGNAMTSSTARARIAFSGTKCWKVLIYDLSTTDASRLDEDRVNICFINPLKSPPSALL